MRTSTKRLLTIGSIVAFLLLIPLIAMMFTNEVNWSLPDFVVAGGLLLGTGLLGELVLQKVRQPAYQIAGWLMLLAALGLVWVEMAVGLFHSPIAGH